MSCSSFKFSYAIRWWQTSQKSSSISVSQTNEKETNCVREKRGETFSRSFDLWFAWNSPSAEAWEKWKELPEDNLSSFTEGFKNTDIIKTIFMWLESCLRMREHLCFHKRVRLCMYLFDSAARLNTIMQEWRQVKYFTYIRKILSIRNLSDPLQSRGLHEKRNLNE